MSFQEPIILTKDQTIQLLLADARNELTKCEVMESLFVRASLKGSVGMVQQLQGQNQVKMNKLKGTIKDLEEIRENGTPVENPPKGKKKPV